ncbi:MAG: hypothetical protein ACK5X3_04575 [Pseudomonadota bacterium]
MSANEGFNETAAAVAATSGLSGMWLSGVSLAWLGVPLPVLLLGLSGAMCARSFLPGLPLPRLLVSVVVGTLAAAAATPLAAHYLGLPASLHLGLAFFAGLFAELALSWLFRRLPDIADRRFGGRE